MAQLPTGMAQQLMALGIDEGMANTMASVAKQKGLLGSEDDGDDKGSDGPIDPARAALVSRWHSRIKAAKKYHDKSFKRIREDQEYARNGCDKSKWDSDTQYTVNLCQRQINVSVAALYARNPRAVAKRKKRLDYKLWDGDAVTLQNAVQAIQGALQQNAQAAQAAAQQGLQAPPPIEPPPQAVAMVQEVQQVKTMHTLLDKVGKTLEICFNYYMNEQEPNFKQQMKGLVRRAKTCGVAFVELDFQRLFEPHMAGTSEIADTVEQLAVIQQMTKEKEDGEMQDDSADAYELNVMQSELQEQETIIAREGPVFNFHSSTAVIVDPKCKDLVTFVGSEWLAIEMLMTPDQAETSLKIDLDSCGGYDTYKPSDNSRSMDAYVGDAMWSGDTKDGDKSVKLCCVWKVYDRKTGTTFVLVDGYKDYAKEPEMPIVKVDKFFPIYTLAVNEVEDEENIYPPSDIWLMRHPQDDYNRSRQGLREHRRANRPKYAAVKGRLEQEDRDKLANHQANAVLELNALNVGEKIEDLLQQIKTVPIDPAVYDVKPQFDDIERAVGSQAANFGGTSGATATESSIAESTRTSVTGSDADALDELLSDLARGTSQAMLMNLSPEVATEIAGPGAVWPNVDREQIMKNLYLDIKAGSSGRPNKAAELANLERGMPFIIQLPGLKPTPILENYLDLLDIDITDAIVDGLPSIMAQNAAAGQVQPSTGNPATDPAAQGGNGAHNAPALPQPPQNMFPAGGAPNVAPPPPPTGPRPHLALPVRPPA